MMFHWKGHFELLLSVIVLLFQSLAVEALQGKMFQNSLPLGGGRSLGAKISGEGVSVVAQSIAFRVVSIFCQGDDPFP